MGFIKLTGGSVEKKKDLNVIIQSYRSKENQHNHLPVDQRASEDMQLEKNWAYPNRSKIWESYSGKIGPSVISLMSSSSGSQQSGDSQPWPFKKPPTRGFSSGLSLSFSEPLFPSSELFMLVNMTDLYPKGQMLLMIPFILPTRAPGRSWSSTWA